MWKKFVNDVSPKTDNEAREEVCVTSVEEVDDVEHENQRNRVSRRNRKSLEKGRPRENTIFDNQANGKESIEHEMTHLPFRSSCRQCIKGRERRDKSQKSLWTTCSWASDESCAETKLTGEWMC